MFYAMFYKNLFLRRLSDGVNRMIKLAQIGWVFLQILNNLESAVGNCPLFGIFLLEILIPFFDQRELVEWKTDALEAHHRCNQWEIGNCDVVSDDILFSDTLQIFLKDF